MAVTRIALCIVRDERSVLPVSNMLHGLYGLEGLCMSIPAVVGRRGIETALDIPLSAEEQEALRRSAETLRGVLDRLDI